MTNLISYRSWKLAAVFVVTLIVQAVIITLIFLDPADRWVYVSVMLAISVYWGLLGKDALELKKAKKEERRHIGKIAEAILNLAKPLIPEVIVESLPEFKPLPIPRKGALAERLEPQV